MKARFSAPVQTDRAVHPASCTMGTGSLSEGVKRPGRDANHTPPSSAEVKERIELYLYSLSGPSWPVAGRTLPFLPLPELRFSKQFDQDSNLLGCYPVSVTNGCQRNERPQFPDFQGQSHDGTMIHKQFHIPQLNENRLSFHQPLNTSPNWNIIPGKMNPSNRQ